MKLFQTNALRLSVATAIATVAISATANAATVSFSSFFTTTDNPTIASAPTVSVDDTAGNLTFNISTANSNALLSAVFIDLVDGFSVLATNLTSLTAGISIEDFEENTNNIGNGRNLNGTFSTVPAASSGSFDFGFGFDDGDNGGAGRQIALPYSFSIDTLDALSIASVERIGLRFQSVGTLGSDGLGSNSEKLIGFASTTLPSPVPLPAALPLLAVALGALGFAGSRRRKSQGI